MQVTWQLACPACGSTAWHSSWEAIMWARCDQCETIWQHTRRAGEPLAVVTPAELAENASLTSSML
jgi:hypothetical protein